MGQRGYRAGKLAIDSYSLGGYWTHIGPGGWYTDTVIMGSHLKVNPKSTAGILVHQGPRLHRVGRSGTADRAQAQPEPGAAGADHLPEYPHRFGQGFRVRRVLRAEERTHRPRCAAAGRVPGQGRHLEALCAGGPGAHAGRTRQGRLQRRHHQHVGHGGTQARLGLGVSVKASERVSVYASAGYGFNLGGERRETVQGNLGVRINW